MYNITNEQRTAMIELAKAHNDSVDNFINVTLKEHFGSDAITLEQWFEAQRLINGQNFYQKGHGIMDILRAFGFNCKMDMQSNKLYCPEIGIF